MFKKYIIVMRHWYFECDEPGVVFFPPFGGKMEIWVIFSPHLRGVWGENLVIFPPPISEGSGGKFDSFSPHTGGKSRTFWEIGIENNRIPYGKLHFSINIAKIFACGALMLPTPTLIRELAAGGEKMSFEVHFDRFPWFIFPPFLTPLGGKFLVSPQI